MSDHLEQQPLKQIMEQVSCVVSFLLGGHPLMTSGKFGDFSYPSSITLLPVLLRPSYIVVQKCKIPYPYLHDVIYEQPIACSLICAFLHHLISGFFHSTPFLTS